MGVTTLQGDYAGRKWSLGTCVPSTYLGGEGLTLSSLEVWPSGSFPKPQSRSGEGALGRL